MSAQLPTGDLTSPTTFMNNTHMKFEPHLSPGLDPQQQYAGDFMNLELGLGDPNGFSQQQQQQQQYGMVPAAPVQPGAADASSGMLLQDPAAAAAAWPAGSTDWGLPSADSGASHGSTELPPAPGLPNFDMGNTMRSGTFDPQAGFRSLTASGSIGMPGLHPGALPQVGAGSPRGVGSPALSFGGGPTNNCSADSMKLPLNGRSLGQREQPAQREREQPRLTQHHSGSLRSSSAAAAAAAAGDGQQQPVFRSQYRGVSYDKKKRKWRVQIKVAALGKSGVSVGYFDTEDAAARAYDRAAIGLLGRQNCRAILNFPIEEYDNDSVPELVGKSREEVKATLKSERAKMPRRRLTNRRRTSRYLGVGSSNRKNQWQARILYHGKVTHLGYYRTEEEAARVYDKVSISLHGAGAQTNFPIDQYKHEVGSLQQKLSGLTREELQRALGVKPMDKSSTYRGVSKKKGRWEAKVMLNRKWAYREMFDTELDAARAYDTAVWRLKPRDARNYANFKDSCPPDVAELLKAVDKDQPLELHPTGLPVTAKPLIEAGLLFDDEGQSIRAPNGVTRTVSIGDLVSLGDSAQHSNTSEPSAGNGSNSAGARPAHSGQGASGGAVGAVAGAPECVGTMAATYGHAGTAAAGGSGGGMVKSASYSALSGLDAGTATSSLVMGGPTSPTDPAAAAAAPVPLNSLGSLGSRGGLQGEMHSHNMQSLRSSGLVGPTGYDATGQSVYAQQHQQQHMGEHMGGMGSSLGSGQHHFGQQQHHGFGAGSSMSMPRVQSVPQLSSYRTSDAGSPSLPPANSFGGSSRGGMSGLQSFGSGPVHHHHQQQQYQFAPQQQQHQQQQQQQQQAGYGAAGQYPGIKLEGTYWSTELSYQDQQQHQQHQQQQHTGLRMSRSCGNLALMGGGGGSPLPPPAQAAMHSSPGTAGSPRGSLQGTFSSGSGAGEFAAENKPLMVRVGSEQHLINPNPTGFKSGMSRIASESHLSSMVPVSPSNHSFLGPERGMFGGPERSGWAGPEGSGFVPQHSSSGHMPMGGHHAAPQHGGFHGSYQQQQHFQQPLQQQQQHPGMGSGYGMGSNYMATMSQGPGMPQFGMLSGPGTAGSMGGMQQQQGSLAGQQQQSSARRNSNTLHRAHSCATLGSIDETSVYGHAHFSHAHAMDSATDMDTHRAHSMPGTLVNGPGSYGMPAQLQQQQQQHLGMMGSGSAPHSSNMMAQQHAGMHPGGAPMGNSMMAPGAMHHPGNPSAGQYGCHMTGAGTTSYPPQGLIGNSGHVAPSGHMYGHSDMGAVSSNGMGAGAGGFGGPSSAPAGFGVPSAAVRGCSSDGSAAAAAKAWQESAGPAWGEVPDSPLGNVQIGGEDLDVAMAFLADGSPPRRLTETDALADSLGLGGLDPSMHMPSPSHSNSAGGLLFDTGLMKMHD